MASPSDTRCGTCCRWGFNRDRSDNLGKCQLEGTRHFKKTAIGGIAFANPWTYDWEGEGCREWRKR